MNVLFICSKNQWRSPTAERLFASHPAVNVRSAGTHRAARHSVNREDIQWADTILVMEDKHKQHLKAQFRHELMTKKVVVLDIPDDYQYMDPELVEWLTEAVTAQLAL